jgi:hypothetical protein
MADVLEVRPVSNLIRPSLDAILTIGPDDEERTRLRRQVGVEDHLSLTRRLLKEYQLDRKRLPALHQILDEIDEREREPRLFLGVVGEFSSGKSTLINALLRDDLLQTDVLQGTTAAATILCYGEDLEVRIRKHGNAVVRFGRGVANATRTVIGWFKKEPEPDRQTLRALIHQATADEKFARNVIQAEVRHPAEALQRGMVIVDLPGTNADNPRHGEVTEAALRDVCDAAIIVVPAIAPGSESLWNFLQNNLETDVLRRCVFILSKSDMVRVKERERVVQDVRARLTRDLKLPNPRVLPAAAGRMLESLPGMIALADGVDPPTPEEKEKWMREFIALEERLFGVLSEQKALLQVERLVRLCEQAFDHLETTLRHREADYLERHEALEKNRIPNLRDFVHKAQHRHADVFARQIEPIANRAIPELLSIHRETVAALSSAIFSAGSRKELQIAAEQRVPAILHGAEQNLQSLLGSILHKLEWAAENEHRDFFGHFQDLYRKLATLGGRVRVESGRLDAQAASTFTAGVSSNQQAMAQYVSGEYNAQIGKQIGGAAAGALIGTLVFPGIGTLLGGFFGGLFGAMFGPSLDELKQKCWIHLEPGVVESFQRFTHTADQCLEEAADELHENLMDTVSSYGVRYQKLVDRMVERDRQEKADLAEMEKKVRRDLNELQSRLQQLGEVREELRSR